jgi:hypothetical protein
MAAGEGVTRHPFHEIPRLFPKCFSSSPGHAPVQNVSDSYHFFSLRLRPQGNHSPVVEHKGVWHSRRDFRADHVSFEAFPACTDPGHLCTFVHAFRVDHPFLSGRLRGDFGRR